jgi:hypothetical protein
MRFLFVRYSDQKSTHQQTHFMFADDFFIEIFISDCVHRIHDFSAVASLFVRNLKNQYTSHILSSSSSSSLFALHYYHDSSAL